MKSLIYFSFLLFCIPTFSKSLQSKEVMSCTLYQLYDNKVFEESLSTYEYPSLSVDALVNNKYDVFFGGSLFSSDDGDKITYETSKDEVSSGVMEWATVEVETEYATYKLEHKITDEENSALLSYKEKEDKKFRKIAKFVCSFVIRK